MIRQRESEGRIRPAISGQVLVIAKLAIFEEEWPDAYDTLQEDPRALDKWHAALREGDLSPLPAYQQDRSFLRFLNSSRDVRVANLSAFIRLKQSREEIELPRFAEFREALVLGTVEEVQEIVASDPERASKYAEHLPAALNDELRRGFLDGARSLVEAAASVPELAQSEDVLRDIFRRAVGESELRAQLRTARPGPLLRSARLLESGDRELLFNEFLDLASFVVESQDRVAEVLDGFASAADVLPSSVRANLKTQIELEAAAIQVGSLASLAEADPDLLPSNIGAIALGTQSSELDVESSEFRVLSNWLRRTEPHPDEEREYLGLVSRVLTRALPVKGGDEQLSASLGALEQGARNLRDLPGDAIQQWYAELGNPLGQWDMSYWPAVLDLLGSIGDIAPEETQGYLQPIVTNFFSSDLKAAIAFALSRTAELKQSLKGPVLNDLAAASVGSDQDQRHPAFDAIVLIDPADERGFFRQALERGVDANLYLTALKAIKRYPTLAHQHVDPIAERTLERLRGLSDPDAIERGLRLLRGVQDELSDTRLNELRDVLGQLLQSGTADLVDVAAKTVGELRGTARFEARSRELVRMSFDHIKGQEPPPPAVVAFVAERVDVLEGLERRAFLDQVARWAKDPSQRADLMRAIRALPVLEPRERELLATSLVEAEIMEAEALNRIELLRAAVAIAGSRGNARRIVRERLETLEHGSEEDRAVWTAVSGPDGGTEDE